MRTTLSVATVAILCAALAGCATGGKGPAPAALAGGRQGDETVTTSGARGGELYPSGLAVYQSP